MVVERPASAHVAPSSTYGIDGDFDLCAAVRLKAELGEVPEEAVVHVDFSHTHCVRDAALAVLADIMCASKAHHVVLDGLTRHQEIVLHYLGVDELNHGEGARG